MIVRVAPGITPVFEQVVYRSGDVVDLPMNVAYRWVGNNWAVEAIEQVG